MGLMGVIVFSGPVCFSIPAEDSLMYDSSTLGGFTAIIYAYTNLSGFGYTNS